MIDGQCGSHVMLLLYSSCYLIGSEQQIQLSGLGVHREAADKQSSDLKLENCTEVQQNEKDIFPH